MSVHLAGSADFSYILDLSKRHAEELGFIPRAAMLAYLDAGRMSVSRENGQDVGYFLTNRVAQRHVRIFQACVQKDARGLRHGMALLSSLVTDAAVAGSHYLSLRCRDGLESNGFWSACGFRVAGISPGGTARGKIIFDWRLDIATALSSPVLPYARDFLARLRPGEAGGAGENPWKIISEAQERARKSGTLLQYLDTRERNVTNAHAHPSHTRSIVAEALRCLGLADPPSPATPSLPG